MECCCVLREELQTAIAWNLGNDRPTGGGDGAAKPGVTPFVPLERGGHTEREREKDENNQDRHEVTHWTLCYQTVSAPHPSLQRAYATCRGIARQHYENFPVASWLLPATMRPHVAAVYAFARYADDFADEGEREPNERLALLDDWGTRLHAAVGGDVRTDSDDPRDLVFAAVAATMRSRDLPVSLFEDLLSAFRQDVTVHRYESWAALMDYCRRSANPVGRLVLRLAGYRQEGLERASDNLCSALQLTNFVQDLDLDWQRGRLYVPSDVSRACGASESELHGERLSIPWRAAVADMVARTRRVFDEGRSVCDAVGGRLGLQLRLTWLGGRRILDRLESNGYDPRVNRPTLGLVDSLPIVWKAASWRRLP